MDIYGWLGLFSAVALGACIGSFLNVCIHRWPRDMGVSTPKRSFCPACGGAIKWWQNIPVLSWLFLRGRCAMCGAPIAFRYVLVEALVAAGFGALWLAFPWPEAVALSVLFVLCVVTVFVDLEHYIIPDQVTLGGIPLGLAAAALAPGLLGRATWWEGMIASAIGAVVGFAVMWAIVELGKKMFGRKEVAFDEAVPWSLREGEESPDLILDGEVTPWEDLFARPSDRLLLDTTLLEINGDRIETDQLAILWDRLEWQEKEGQEAAGMPLEKVKSIGGRTTRAVIPREAMGLGDVKFMAMAGAFSGAIGVAFTLFAACLLGSVFGLTAILLRRRQWSTLIPFGPWLVVGLWIWLLKGEAIALWYLELAGLPVPGSLSR